MIFLEDSKDARAIQSVAASMAIENMYVSKEFVNELLQVSQGKKTYDDVRQELIKKYARQ